MLTVSWLLPGLLCAFFYALQGAVIKLLLLRGLNRYVTTWVIFVTAFPFMIAYLGLTGIPTVQNGYVPAFCVSLGINLVAMLILVSAIQKTGIGQVYVYLSFTPLFILLTGYLLLGEKPSGSGVLGIVLMVMGSYCINLTDKMKSVTDPFRNLKQNKGSILALIVALLWSVSAPVDKIAVKTSSIVFYITMFNLTFIIAYLPVVLTKNNRPNLKKLKPLLPYLVCLGVVSFLMIFFQFKALLITDVSYVISMKRGGFLFSIIIGSLLFNEIVSKRNILGSLIILLGLVFLAYA